MTYTKGWPATILTDDLLEVDVVPFSDAERLREENEELRGALGEILSGDHYGDLTAIYETARAALDLERVK